MRNVIFIIFISASFILPFNVLESQEKSAGSKKSRLESDIVINEGKDLDSLISELNKKIQHVLTQYKLVQLKDIRLLPYQVSYTQGDNFIQVEKYSYYRDPLSKRITEIKSRSMKLFLSGENISKTESIIRVKDYNSNVKEEVVIVDPTPASQDNNDITFTHKRNGRVIVENKKMGAIRNTSAFPVRNELKREFLVPHLTYFYDVLLNISETYYKGIKDTDNVLFEFLEKSTAY